MSAIAGLGKTVAAELLGDIYPTIDAERPGPATLERW